MKIAGLGYVGLRTAHLNAWSAFASDVLGARVVEVSHGLRVQFDDRMYRLDVRASNDDGLEFIGWEVANEPAFRAAVEELRAAGRQIEVIAEKEARVERAVSGLARFRDPAGTPLELFYGAQVSGQPVVSTYGARFVTGELGAGHVVLLADNFAETYAFYTEVFGFRLSDHYRAGSCVFLRCNPRHHCLAIVDANSDYGRELGGAGFDHIMFETDDINAVGQAYDRCVDGAAPLATTLGRHSNDHMFSFYVFTPSGFAVEYGYGGRLVDDATWQVTELAGEDIFGHRPVPTS